MHKEKLTLATIGGGAVQERVDRTLEKVARNIMDPNTDPGKKRVITLKITMKPDEDDREDVEVSADVQVSLAPEMGVSTHFFVSKDLKSDRVSVMEHRKGEIRGQLDFSDVGIVSESDEDTEESTTEATIMDFRKKKA